MKAYVIWKANKDLHIVRYLVESQLYEQIKIIYQAKNGQKTNSILT